MKFTKPYQMLTLAGLMAAGALMMPQRANAQSTTRADAIKDVRHWENQVAYERLRLQRARTRSEREDALKDLRNAENRLAEERRDAARFGVSPRTNYRTNYNRPGKPNHGWGYGREKNRSRWEDRHDDHH
jgi:hypothetical protein